MRPFIAFDTATDHLALAVGDLDAPGAVLAADDFTSPRAANTVLLSAVERLLASIDLEPRSLHAVAVGRGPGSFTGVRIGVATAKGLAHGLGVPLCGFGTADAVARRSAEEGLLGVVGDAMRGEVYPALFRTHAGLTHRLSSDRVAHPAEVAAEWAALSEPVTLTGNGLVKHRAELESTLGQHARIAAERLWTVDGASLIAAAWANVDATSIPAICALDRARAFELAHPQAMLPIYTRLADAEETERVRAGHPERLPDGGVAGPASGGSL